MRIKNQDVLKSAGCYPATVSDSHTPRDTLLLPMLIFFRLIFCANEMYILLFSHFCPATSEVPRQRHFTVPLAEPGTKI